VKVISAYNVNDAYAQGVTMFRKAIEHDEIDIEPSRAGPVFAWPVPVTTHYQNPCERILWDRDRDCNPFFHFFESMWMLAGHNDVEYVTKYNMKMGTFSDDGRVYHGAYGYRWREQFAVDQLIEIANHLRANPTSRRAVMQIWDCVLDLNKDGKDLPCNCTVKFELRPNGLRMVVFNRSNDMLFGAYGANAVHFSIMQEFVAALIGCPVLDYYQVSCNMHVYENVWKDKVPQAVGAYSVDDKYVSTLINPVKLFTPGHAADDLKEIEMWVDGCREPCMTSPIIVRVARPLDAIWECWKAKDREAAYHILDVTEATDPNNDWLKAARQWMLNRKNK